MKGMNRLFRLVAADIDDTVLDPTGKMTPRTENAFRSAIAAGAYVVLASGRMIDSTRPYANRIGVNAPLVVYNGAIVYDLANEKILSSMAISLERAREINAEAEKDGIYVQLHTARGFYTKVRTYRTDAYSKSVGLTAIITGDRLFDMVDTDPVKMLFICDPADTPGYIEKYSRMFPDVAFMMSKPYYVEIVAKGVDKSISLEKVLAMLDVKPEEMIAFGDGENDLSMLKMAGRGYCMMNARDHVREKCSLFAPPNSEDGCAQIIESLLEKGELGGA